MVYSVIEFTNQIGLGTIATFSAIAACFWAIRGYISSTQADEIAALKDKIRAQGSDIVDLRAKLAEEKARPDMTALQKLLVAESEWKRAELKEIRASSEESRSEHAQIVEALQSMQKALDLLVDWGRSAVEGNAS